MRNHAEFVTVELGPERTADPHFSVPQAGLCGPVA